MAKKEVEKEKEAIKWKGEELVLVKKKWLDIGERVSRVGHLSCTAGMEGGEWMEEQRVAM